MIRRLIQHVITRQERKLGVSLDYMRQLSQSSLSAFLKFSLAMPLCEHRRHLPREAFHLARLAATKVEDCGTCVQIVVNIARQDGVDADLLRAALKEDHALPAHLAEVMAFAKLVASGGDSEELRTKLKGVYGEAGFIELTLAITTARIFPTLKRGLGHAVSCSRVSVEI